MRSTLMHVQNYELASWRGYSFHRKKRAAGYGNPADPTKAPVYRARGRSTLVGGEANRCGQDVPSWVRWGGERGGTLGSSVALQERPGLGEEPRGRDGNSDVLHVSSLPYEVNICIRVARHIHEAPARVECRGESNRYSPGAGGRGNDSRTVQRSTSIR